MNTDAAAQSSQLRRRFWHNADVEEYLLSYDIECVVAHVRMLSDTGLRHDRTISWFTVRAKLKVGSGAQS